MIDNPSIFREALVQKVAKITECGQKFLSSKDRIKFLPTPQNNNNYNNKYQLKRQIFPFFKKNKSEKANNGKEKKMITTVL